MHETGPCCGAVKDSKTQHSRRSKCYDAPPFSLTPSLNLQLVIYSEEDLIFSLSSTRPITHKPPPIYLSLAPAAHTNDMSAQKRAKR